MFCLEAGFPKNRTVSDKWSSCWRWRGNIGLQPAAQSAVEATGAAALRSLDRLRRGTSIRAPRVRVSRLSNRDRWSPQARLAVAARQEPAGQSRLPRARLGNRETT